MDICGFPRNTSIFPFHIRSSQAQALNAVVFLYKQELSIDLGLMVNRIYAKRRKQIPVVFSHNEVNRIINHLSGKYELMASLMHGSGLRVGECVQLRVKDIDFEYHAIFVR